MTAQNLHATILSPASGTWKLSRVEIELLNNLSLPEICYIFLDKESYLGSENNRRELLRLFNIPDSLSYDVCTGLNGYFGCRGTYYNKEKNEEKKEKLESYSTWFRYSVKMVPKAAESSPNGTLYKWYEMDFFTRWDHSGHYKVLCIDTPEEMPREFEIILQELLTLDQRDPFAMHVPLFDRIIRLYDDSVWRIRDAIRYIEQSRLSASRGLDFGHMHEIYRHSLHVSETISATIETIEAIQRQPKVIYSRLPFDLGETHREHAQGYINFQLQIIKMLKLRASSSHERLKSEITLAYNISIASTAKSTAKDNSSMKTIAILTTLFLPFTFMAILLTTPIFKWPDPPEGQVVVTLPFVIYWVVSFVLTLVIGSVMWCLTTSESSGIWKKVLTLKRRSRRHALC